MNDFLHTVNLLLPYAKLQKKDELRVRNAKINIKSFAFPLVCCNFAVIIINKVYS